MKLIKSLAGLRWLLSLPLLAAAAGCTEAFDPDVKSSPVAVLNVMAMPDSALTVSLTRSWPFGGARPDRATVTLRNARVTLTVNGSDTHILAFDDSTLSYVTAFAPAPGDLLEIEAVDPVYGRVRGATTVPLPPSVDSLSVKSSVEIDPNSMWWDSSTDEIKHIYAYVNRYTLTFTDPGDTDDYYMFAGRDIDVEGEPIFGENLSALDVAFDYDWADLLMFSDRKINGSTYTLTFRTSFSLRDAWIAWSNAIHWDHELPRFADTVRFYRISRAYYAYLVSIYQKYGGFQADLENVGLAEPTAVYSNVEGGTGIVCSQTPVVYVRDLTDEIVGLFPDEDDGE